MSSVRSGRLGVRVAAGATDFHIFQNVDTGSQADPACYSVGAFKLFIRGQSGRDVRLTTRLHLVLTLSMSGAIPGHSICFHGVSSGQLYLLLNIFDIFLM